MSLVFPSSDPYRKPIDFPMPISGAGIMAEYINGKGSFFPLQSQEPVSPLKSDFTKGKARPIDPETKKRIEAKKAMLEKFKGQQFQDVVNSIIERRAGGKPVNASRGDFSKGKARPVDAGQVQGIEKTKKQAYQDLLNTLKARMGLPGTRKNA